MTKACEEHEEYLTVEQAAEVLHVSTRQVRRYMSDGLATVRKGKLVRIRRRDLDTYMAQFVIVGNAADGKACA